MENKKDSKKHLSELEYAILISDSDFTINLAKDSKIKLKDKKHQKFCSELITAINAEREWKWGKAAKIWLDISKNKEYTTNEQCITKIKYLNSKIIRKKIKDFELKNDLEFKNLNDHTAQLISKSNSLTKEKKIEVFKKMSKNLLKFNYKKTAKLLTTLNTGGKKFPFKKDEILNYQNAAKSFKKLKAMDLYHNALAAEKLCYYKKDDLKSSIHFVLEAADEFKKAKDHGLYHITMTMYHRNQASLEQKNSKKSERYRKASVFAKELDDKQNYYESLGDAFNSENKPGDKPIKNQIQDLEKAREYYKLANLEKKIIEVEGLMNLLRGTGLKNLFEAATFFKEAAKCFKKINRTKIYNEMMGLYYFTLSGAVIKIEEKLQMLKKSEKFYRLCDNQERVHRSKGYYFFHNVNLVKKLDKKVEAYLKAAEEFEKSEHKDMGNLCKGHAYYVQSLLEKGTKQVELLLKSAEYYKNANKENLLLESVGRACFIIALASRNQKSASDAANCFRKVKNEPMEVASLLVNYEILAENETDEIKKKEYYKNAATFMKKFVDFLNLDEKVEMPKNIIKPNLKEIMLGTYEYYSGLSSENEKRNEHFRKSEEYYKKSLIIDTDDKQTLLASAFLYRDWKKLDESHTCFKKLAEKNPENDKIMKEFEISENLLKTDYTRTKEELANEKLIRIELQRDQALQISLQNKGNEDQSEFIDKILGIISEIGADLQTKPSTYNKLSETEIRDVFHTTLTTALPGGATRESFRKIGPTDVHIIDPTDPTRTIVIEFKLWDGKKYYQQGLDQIFDYATVSDDNSILITLNKIKDWTRVLEESRKASQEYKFYKEESIKSLSLGSIDTAFTTNNLDDRRKNPLKIYHILFDIFDGERRKQ